VIGTIIVHYPELVIGGPEPYKHIKYQNDSKAVIGFCLGVLHRAEATFKSTEKYWGMFLQSSGDDILYSSPTAPQQVESGPPV
jgi:hypothetical protein